MKKVYIYTIATLLFGMMTTGELVQAASASNMIVTQGKAPVVDPAEGTKADQIEDQQRAAKAKHHHKHHKKHKQAEKPESPATEQKEEKSEQKGK